MEPYVIACDLGTSGVKVVAFGLKGGVFASATEKYDLYVQGNRAEQDPEQYWQAICRAAAGLRAQGVDPQACRGLAFGTQWRGIIPIDAQGRLLRRSIIWMDKRAAQEAQELNNAMGAALFCAMDYWPKLLWLRKNEPEIYDSAALLLEPNAYLKWRATGRAVSDVTNSYTRSPNPDKQAFYDRLLRCAGLDADKFPPLCEATELAGRVTPEAAQALGLPAGLPVFGGCCDIPALAIGSGCSAEGAVHAYLGTSGWLGCIERCDPTDVYRPPLDAAHDVGFYSLGVSVGPSTDWLLDTLYGAERARLGAGIWRYLDEELDRVPPGAERLLLAPWFFGGRPPLSANNARGVFLNLGSQHTRAHMYRALLEGYCYLMRQRLEQVNARRAAPVQAVTVCGGGSANRHWMQAMADILRVRVQVPRDAQSTGAAGVAYCALIGLGQVSGFDALQEQVELETCYDPNPAHFAEYDLLYHQFVRLYPLLSEVFDALNPA